MIHKIFKRRNLFFKLNPAHILVLGFLSLILIGTLLLMLPISTQDRHHLSFIDALFEATSAVCVTGLAVVDTGNTFTVFGQIILLILIQLGGWGFMTSGILMFLVLGKKIGIKKRLLLQESINSLSLQGIIKLVQQIIMITLVIELVGATILAIRWSYEMPWPKAIYYGIFHTVSAFNNAGFGLESDSLSKWVGDPIVNIIITFLFISGGIGFIVILDVIKKRKIRDFSLHTKLVLVSTLFLNIISSVIILCLEYNNPATLGVLPLDDKIWASYFQGVVPRTAGFNTIDIGQMTMSSQVYMIALMFIGASSGSTGGGIKVTTAFLLLLSIIAIIRNRAEIHIFKRRISQNLVNRAIAIATTAIMFIFIIFFLLTITEKGAEFSQILFETVSAFGTVGLSAGLTGDLTPVGRILITIMMFIGRLGPLTMAFALAMAKNERNKIRYAEEKILIG
ncbi:TrkH family potassium uptake protein [Bacillus cereus group sp. MYBK40-2]|uniref:Ktr system potassium transporter B n=1 Tax=Bacillus thuringiensis TaxID=1428 RepID=A0A0B5NZK9_BACTU|nr:MULTISPECIES: TrkH family potassium uptake protein [Bacillus]AJG79416.1 ktr system potassium uptake protein B [Bacillus thuringiensis]AJI32189.1 ktr system potassium uptake protein B [Bacillus thuringiensis]MCU5430558.1 TrkH family potassium uptake protein [Bacillus cereus]MDA1815349.1 TrkH family potassium uptake protein [Bacillus cereus]MDA1850816.1 TrkH family potassium uptake protein [Bacillus cereus]